MLSLHLHFGILSYVSIIDRNIFILVFALILLYSPRYFSSLQVMFMTAAVNEALHDAKDYGFDIAKKNQFDWAMLKEKRDAYVKRLNGIYKNNLAKDNITYIEVRYII